MVSGISNPPTVSLSGGKSRCVLQEQQKKTCFRKDIAVHLSREERKTKAGTQYKPQTCKGKRVTILSTQRGKYHSTSRINADTKDSSINR